MAYIEDASSRVLARFYADEGTIPAMDRCTRDVTRYGIPLALEADTQTTEHSPAPPTVDEPWPGESPRVSLGGRGTSWGAS